MKREGLLGPISTLIGTVIGAGVLGIPYVFSKSGFLPGLCVLVLLGLVVLASNLMIGEACLRTNKFLQLVGLAAKYLGRKGKTVMTLTFVGGIWGALVAYIIGVGGALSALFGNPTLLGLPASLLFSFLFFAVASALVYFGLKAVERSEIILSFLVITVIIVVSALAFGHIDLSNLAAMSWKHALVPYGVVLFALLGAAAIPEMNQELRNNKRVLRKSILIGMAIPIVLYAIFALVVVGVTGIKTTEVATIGLGETLGPIAILLGNVFAILAMAGSFLILGLALKDMFMRDLHLRKKLAFCLTVFVPLALFLLGAKSFVGVIGLVGAFAGGIEGIMIVLIWRKAKKTGNRRPEYAIKFKWAHWLIIAIFSGGIVYTILNLIGVV